MDIIKGSGKGGDIIPMSYFKRYSYAKWICHSCHMQPCIIMRCNSHIPYGCLYPNKSQSLQQTPKWTIIEG